MILTYSILHDLAIEDLETDTKISTGIASIFLFVVFGGGLAALIAR